MPGENEDRKHTRHLGQSDATPMPERGTGPLDQVIPWVIEFRVVGTHHIIKVPAKEAMMVGRADTRNGIYPDIDVSQYAAQALGVSRKHALISVQRNRVTIRDLGSPNGTFINDHVLNPKQEYRLRNGDQLRFGRLQLQIHFVVKPTLAETTQEVNSVDDLQIEKIGNGQTILIVDDDEQVSKLLQMVLDLAGFTPVMAKNITQGVTAIEKEMPSAVITELFVGDQSGLELVHHVRQLQAEGSYTPIMAISTATAGFQMGQAIEEGVDMFLGKPFAIEELMRGIGKLVDEMR